MYKKTTIFTVILTIVLLSACQLAKYPPNQIYAHKIKIDIKGNYDTYEKKVLLNKLEKQLDDSLVYSRKRKKLFGFIPYTQKQYHTFDTVSINRTFDFFKATYVANGYFRGGISTAKVNSVKGNDTFRKEIVFTVQPFQNHKIDTIIYAIPDSGLLAITLSSKGGTVLHKNDYYSQDLLDAERRRLAALYRNNGYLKINKDDIKIIADTINTALIQIPEDVVEQQQLYEKAIAFNNKPTTTITLKISDTLSKAKLSKYYIGNINVHTDNINEDSLPPNKDAIDNTSITKYYYQNTFKNNIIKDNIYFKKGDLFNQDALDKTVERFNFLGPWKQVIVSANDTNQIVDFTFYMLPYAKYSRDIKLEGSYNQNNNNSIITNLLGTNVTFNLKNRNFNKDGIQTNFLAIASAEFGQGELINTYQGGLSYTFTIPKFVPKLRWLAPKGEAKQSFINTNTNFAKKIDDFELVDLGVGYGLQWRGAKKWSNQLILPNIENKNLKILAGLAQRIAANPLLGLYYSDGLIFSGKFNATNKVIKKENLQQEKLNFTTNRFGVELSGFPTGISKTIDSNLFSFAKLELEKTWNIQRPKATWAFRTMLGIGFNPFNTSLQKNEHLPFFRQFISGGPNSMRAWTIRSLSSYSTRTNSNTQNTYFGDVQAEVNAEYRFLITKLIGIPIRGAFFIDAGNIWNWKPIDKTAVPSNLNSVQKIANDIGIAAGTSVRVDFTYFIIRLDIGLKIKEPNDINGGGGWFRKDNFNLINLKPYKLQVGIGYPF